jgi:hypothetical protein
MNCEEFWLNVLSNSLAALFAGTILGLAGTLIISAITRKKEKRQKTHEKELSEAIKKLTFLETIKDEIVSIIVGIQTNGDALKTIGSLTYIRYDISYWEILKTSGEIPLIFSPETLQIITQFYSRISKCNLLFEQLLLLDNSPHLNNIQLIFNELQKEIRAIRLMIQSVDIEGIIEKEMNFTNAAINTLKMLR